VFDEGTDVHAEKRGNFVVLGCIEGSRVVSWSFNALNNSETLRLLASIELACYKCRLHSTARRQIDRVIRDDRRRRHRRRKEQEALVDAFAKHDITEPPEFDEANLLDSKEHSGEGKETAPFFF